MKFVVLGDAHLWPVLWQRMPEARGDAFVAAEQVFKHAVDNRLPVVSSGDIFNFGQKGGVANCLTFLQRWIPALEGFHYIVGNHDLTGYTNGLVNAQWLQTVGREGLVHHLTDYPYEMFNGKIRVGGIDYCHGRTEFLQALETAAKAELDVLVIHQGLKEILSYEGAWEVECSELEGVARLVVCGHTHVSWDKVVGNTRIISPGSTVPWQLDEEHEKKFPVIDMDAAKEAVPALEWVDIPFRRPFITATVVNDEQKKKAIQIIEDYKLNDRIPESVRMPILKMRYIADEKFHKELMEAAKDKMHLDLTVDRIQLTGKLNLGALEDKPEDVDDVVVATHKHTSPGRVRDAAIEIQRTKDPEGVIEKHINEITGAQHDVLV